VILMFKPSEQHWPKVFISNTECHRLHTATEWYSELELISQSKMDPTNITKYLHNYWIMILLRTHLWTTICWNTTGDTADHKRKLGHHSCMPHCLSLFLFHLFREVTKTTGELFRSLKLKQEPRQSARRQFYWMWMCEWCLLCLKCFY
jgi:hypothetical protein